MGRCIRCSAQTPGGIQGEMCPVCRQRERLQKEALQKSDISTVSGASSYRPSANSWQTNARIHRSGSGIKTLIVIAIVLIGVFLGIRYWNYTSFEDSLNNQFAIDAEISGDSTSFINEIVTRKEDYAQWSISITKMPVDYISSVFSFLSEKTVRIRQWTEDGVDSYYFYFYSGFDMGTGLTGRFYLTTIDGKKCLISENDETVYQEGAAFYGEHYEQLMAMTYDAVIPDLTKQLIGGEYGNNEDFSTVVLKTDTVFASVAEENDYTKIIDEGNEERLCYVLNYSKKASESVPDISEYKVVKE